MIFIKLRQGGQKVILITGKQLVKDIGRNLNILVMQTP
jgi:hypothetical protein